MFEILAKFFKFSGRKNGNKFKLSIVIGLVEALASAMKIPAIMYILIGLINKEAMGKYIGGSLAIMVIAIVIDIICKRFSTVLQTEGGYNASAFMRIKIAEHLRYLPMGYFNSNSIGEISSVTTNTMEMLGDIATRVVMLTTQGILETAMIVLMILIFDWRIGLLSAAGVVIFFIINSIMQKVGKSDSEKKVLCDTELISQIMEYIQGISEVKSYNLLGKQAKRLNAANEACAEINTKMELLFVPYHFLQGAVTKITGAVIVICSAVFYINGTMSAVYAIGMTIAAFMLYSSLECAGNYSSLLHVVSVCVDKANAILELDTMDIDGKEIRPQSCDIALEHVSFSYDKRKIIDDVSLTIPQRTTTAIVGPSGGGKSTLCNLIARFWDVDAGRVTLGGVDVKEYSMNSLMSNFSFVFQTVYLFADTIENNIKFGRQDATHEEVVEAAKKACCHDFISQLPDGYNTVIAEGGSTLSGGQKQRISIARAIMKDAPIVILDEATANVDPENEKELMDAVAALTKEKTIIMIAHRLKTVRHADRIVVVDKGRIVQQGTHEQLMQQEGIYRRFVDAREQAVSWKL
ncbi:MAG: ABC transporter ATP-binding protein [Agathobacter sp.]|uniref:ABC transporter ATP-binding protein n=1 Tax=Agathobacter sp. TaxID=2021311 RepID=UPI003994CF6B